MHKPSLLWPPPGEVESKEVREDIRPRLGDKERFHSVDLGASTSASSVVGGKILNVVGEQNQRVEGKEPLVMESQIQFYAPNNLLPHPLISPCRAYLGGLPPLFFIASDHEVLRDEIIYTCVSSLHRSIPLLSCILELTEQQTRPSSRSQLNLNYCIPRSRSSQQNTPLRLRFTSKFTTGVHMSCPSSLHSQLPRSTVSELSPVSVVS
jgi:hypothetical protein